MLRRVHHTGMKPGDIFVTLDDTGLGKGETPLREELYLYTEEGCKGLDGSALLYAKELRLAVALERCTDSAQFDRPLEERTEELAGYRQAGCVFRKSPDPDGNFYQVERAGSGTVWICNEGQRSLRFQTADGLLYRVCAGTVQPLDPANAQARIQPPKILLDVDSGGPLDIHIRAVHVLDGAAWRRGGVYLHCGDYTDSYHLRVQYGDDCLGVFEAYSSYFMGRPALEVLDIDSYGPSQWYIRGLGDARLALRCAGCGTASVPADRTIYALKDLLPRDYALEDLQPRTLKDLLS